MERHRFLIPTCKGSNPFTPKKIFKKDALTMMEDFLPSIPKAPIHPKVFPQLLGTRLDRPIIDQDQLKIRLKRAKSLFQSLLSKQANILIVCTDPHYSKLIAKLGQSIQQPYVNYIWVDGLLTNWKQVVSSKQLADASLASSQVLKKKYKGLKFLTKKPDLLLIIKPEVNSSAIREAHRLKIPIVCLVEIDRTDLKGVDFWIPLPKESSHLIYQFAKLLFNIYHFLSYKQKIKPLLSNSHGKNLREQKSLKKKISP